MSDAGESIVTTETGTSCYTHTICGRCGTVLHCSEVQEWDNYGTPTGMGWCPHLEDDEGVPIVAFTTSPTPTDWHLCVPSPTRPASPGEPQ